MIMENFYNLFEVPKNASIPQIIHSYENKMLYYSRHNRVLTQADIILIKSLNAGKYILTNVELRNKYDLLLLKKELDEDSISIKIPETKKPVETVAMPQIPQTDENILESMAENSSAFDSFDSVFSVDNSWMKKIDVANVSTTDLKKSRTDSNQLSNRVFSMKEFNKKDYSAEVDSNFRRPVQCREDKSS